MKSISYIVDVWPILTNEMIQKYGYKEHYQLLFSDLDDIYNHIKNISFFRISIKIIEKNK